MGRKWSLSYWLCLALACWATRTQAADAWELAENDTDGFATLYGWMDKFMDFMQGQFGPWVVALSVIMALVVWNFAPREGLMANVSKGIVAGLVIMNMGAWMKLF